MTENQIRRKDSGAKTRAALLALAADSGEKTGECLTPEAMAAFLDNTCSPGGKGPRPQTYQPLPALLRRMAGPGRTAARERQKAGE